MKILLTGATGYIGKRLLPILAGQGHEVICCVRDKNRFYATPEFQKNITVKANETTQIVVEMDHQRQFGTSTQFVNIAQDPIFHDGGPFMIAFMNNYQSSIHL